MDRRGKSDSCRSKKYEDSLVSDVVAASREVRHSPGGNLVLESGAVTVRRTEETTRTRKSLK